MFTNSKDKNNRIILKGKIRVLSILSLLSLSLVANAQKSTIGQEDDSALLDSFIQAKGLSGIISFTPSNIKQFWTDKSVLSQDNSIRILLEDGQKSLPFRIQLANVKENQDCRIDVISSNSDFSFSILDRGQKKLSTSSAEDNFINYSVASASFHMEDTSDFSFYLQFSSAISVELEIKKIILSFSNNKNSLFLASPGTLVVTESNCTGPDLNKMNEKNTFSATGKNSRIMSNNKVFVSNNTIRNSVKVKNIGEKPTRVFFGYALYTKEKKIIDTKSNPYNYKNKVLKIVSAEPGSTSIIVDTEPEWRKGSVVALNAKEDLSDFPNRSFVAGSIQDVKKIDDNHFEIFFDKPNNNKDVKAGMPVRVQGFGGGSYLYTNDVILQPGEETTLSSSIKKDDDYVRFGQESFCRGTYYVTPVLLSYSVNKDDENTVQITDFTVSY